MAKIELADFVKYGELHRLYGKLLSLDRQEIMKQYFDYNMTLAEISKERKVSRQAVLDSISKSCQKLDEYESALRMQERTLMLKKELNEIRNEKSLQKIKQKVEDILGEL